VTGPRMAVLHLSTGHVVAAMTIGRRVPTVADVTGGEHIVVRIPGGRVVRVPAELLTGLAAPVREDVLARPTDFLVTNATPNWRGKLTAWVNLPSKPGSEALSIWDGGAEPVFAWQSLDNTGKLPPGHPAGTTHRLVAVAGERLMYKKP